MGRVVREPSDLCPVNPVAPAVDNSGERSRPGAMGESTRSLSTEAKGCELTYVCAGASAGVRPSGRAKAFHDAKRHDLGGGSGELMDCQAGELVVQVPEPVPPGTATASSKVVQLLEPRCQAWRGVHTGFCGRSGTLLGESGLRRGGSCLIISL